MAAAYEDLRHRHLARHEIAPPAGEADGLQIQYWHLFSALSKYESRHSDVDTLYLKRRGPIPVSELIAESHVDLPDRLRQRNVLLDELPGGGQRSTADPQASGGGERDEGHFAVPAHDAAPHQRRGDRVGPAAFGQGRDVPELDVDRDHRRGPRRAPREIGE